MADITVTISGVHTTGDVLRFVEIVEALGISGRRSLPFTNDADGMKASISVRLTEIRLPLDERD